MNTVTVSAAVSAIVTVLVGTFFNWGARIVSWLRRLVPPDHRSLSLGSGWSTQANSATDQVRMTVCCAPNRSLRQRELHPERAVDFVREQFPGLFPEEPVFSIPPMGVRFEAEGGVERGYAWVHASGRIDLCVNVSTTPAELGPITVSVVDLVEPVLVVLRAARSAAYDRTFGSRWPGLRRRFDWAIAVSPTINIPNRGGVSWDDLVFPGRPPPRAGTAQQAFCPPLGFAAADLRNWNVRRSDDELLRYFLRDFLQQNGFHGVDAAIADTLKAIKQPALDVMPRG